MMESWNPNNGILNTTAREFLKNLMLKFGFNQVSSEPKKDYLDSLEFYNPDLQITFKLMTRTIADECIIYCSLSKNIDSEIQSQVVFSKWLPYGLTKDTLLKKDASKEEKETYVMKYLVGLEKAFSDDQNDVITGKRFIENTKESTDEFYKRFK